MARTPVLAAGGIVLRLEDTPLIAVVRLRKRNEWVLPKGKLDDGETPRAAAEREVIEETGHDVAVHEFLGTLVYESGGRSKVVHYWRMEAEGEPVHELMNDVKAVDWLPLRTPSNGCRADMNARFLKMSDPSRWPQWPRQCGDRGQNRPRLKSAEAAGRLRRRLRSSSQRRRCRHPIWFLCRLRPMIARPCRSPGRSRNFGRCSAVMCTRA